MKTTKKIVQWIVFVAVALGTILGLALVLSLMAGELVPVIGGFAALVLMFAVLLGGGALLGYCGVLVWLWLAERGWFL